MLLPFRVRFLPSSSVCDVLLLRVRHNFPLPKIENCKDEYPHQIDEVPIQTHGFDNLVVSLPAGEEAWPLVIQIPPYYLYGHDDQEDHADRHVRAMETRDHEKARAKLRRAPRVAPRPDSFHDQLGPLEGLHADE